MRLHRSTLLLRVVEPLFNRRQHDVHRQHCQPDEGVQLLIRRPLLDRLVAAIALVIVATLAGCSTSNLAPPVSEATSGLLHALQAPPEDVPVAIINTTVLSPSQFRWIVHGTWQQKTVTGANEVPITHVVAGSKVLLRLNSPVRPFQLLVGLYSKLDANGIPVEGTEAEVDCLSSEACSVTAKGNKLEIAFQRPGSVQIASIRVAYLKPKTESSQLKTNPSPDLLTVAWVVRFD